MKSLRAIEFYSGIGGFTAAFEGEVVQAFEMSDLANDVYAQNFGKEPNRKNLEAVSLKDIEPADIWWLSPPCQPFTVRGAKRDVADPRSRSFFHLIELAQIRRPRWIMLENVEGFVGSSMRMLVLDTLARSFYDLQDWVLCPTELGVPGRRRRYYLVATRRHRPGRYAPLKKPVGQRRKPLQQYLEEQGGEPVAPAILERFGGVMRILDPACPLATANCFTSAYGKTWSSSGSFLQVGEVVRHFSPREILNLLGFPAGFSLGDSLAERQKYRLVGNSLSVDAVRAVLTAGIVEELRGQPRS